MTAPACHDCGSTGGYDATGRYRKTGRRNQGAISPQWARVEHSPTLGLDLCTRCWRLRFYRQARPLASNSA